MHSNTKMYTIVLQINLYSYSLKLIQVFLFLELHMSQETTANNTEQNKLQLLIDLTNAQQATVLDAGSILHRMQL